MTSTRERVRLFTMNKKVVSRLTTPLLALRTGIPSPHVSNNGIPVEEWFA